MLEQPTNENIALTPLETWIQSGEKVAGTRFTEQLTELYGSEVVGRRLQLGESVFTVYVTGELGGIRAVVFDMDDVLNLYKEAKTEFRKRLLTDVFKVDETEIERCNALLQAINKHARVVPKSGTHPERYSPHFELAVLSRLLLKNGELENWADEYSKISEAVKKEYMHSTLNELVVGDAELKQRYEMDENDYFVEKEHHLDEVDFKKRPDDVDEKLWTLFTETLLQPGLRALDFFRSRYEMLQLSQPDRESLEQVAFDGDEYADEVSLNNQPTTDIILNTFGRGDFQAAKTVNLIRQLSGHQRPNMIIVCEEGRKIPTLFKMAQFYSYMEYVDNSLSNISKIQALQSEGVGNKIAIRHFGVSHKKMPVVEGTDED